jgi:serine/threonine protein kinase
VKFLGSGQFGNVYQGDDGNSDKFAVKVIDKSKISNDKLKEMLKSEVSIMQKMNHPNIIHLFDFMESSSNYYLAMQACNNGDMTKYMEKMGKKYWSEEEAIFYLKQIASGFRELHRHKVMHRDFKLDNLFMDDDIVVIADLGFAKAGREMTQTQCGTPLYMAPEIFAGKKYTNSADLWSVGVSFYQLLFGTFPFDANSTYELQQKIQKESGPNLRIPRHVNPISKQCEELLRSILTADPDRRIKWASFFNHPLFAENAGPSKRQLGGHGGTMAASMIQVNNRFNQDKNEDHSDDVTLHEAHQYGDACGSLECVNEDSRMDDDHWQQKQKEVRLLDTYKENNERYWHERNKILFMFTTVRKLRDLNKKIHPQNPARKSIVFFNIVLAQKALIFLQFNVNSLIQPVNLFKLQDFESWLQSSYSKEVSTQFNKDFDSLKAYFEYMRGDERELDFSQYDRNMLQTLSAQTPLKLLDEIMDYKVREMINMKNDYNITGNPALEAEWLVALYHADNALKGEKVFLYTHGNPMDWNKFYSTLNGDVNSLRAWVQKM